MVRATLAFALTLLCVRDVSAWHSEEEGHDAEVTSVKMDAEMHSMVKRLLERKGGNLPSRHEMIKTGLQKVDPKDAAERLQGKLPADVASLVSASVKTSKGKSQQPFSEDSLAKARKYLNQMMEGAWAELDDKVIECKEFEDRNRGSFEQVMTDIARLGEQIADLQRVIAETVEFINTKDLEILAVQAKLKQETTIYLRIYYTNKQEITIRKNDLAVFQFMLKLTKCKSGAALVQLDRDGKTGNANMCSTAEGLVFDFEDKKAQHELERMMTPGARAAIRQVLGQMDMLRAKDGAALLQQAAKSDHDDDDDDDIDADGAAPKAEVPKVLSALGVKVGKHDATTTTTTTQGIPTPPVPKDPVVKRLDITVGSVKCPTEPPDCGLLHDNMSLMWGKFKDLVDELQAEMDKNEFEFEELKFNYNQQLEVLRSSKAKFNQDLAEATGNLNSDREEMAEKEEMRVTLEHEYKVYMKECKARIEWIMFQDICAYLKVRATIMTFSKVSPPEKITDCGVSAWVPGECSVPCDDTCPDKKNPYGCGGWQTLDRTIVVAANEFGLKCPELVRKRKCGQIKCPVDCAMSKWSSWSKCTKECEGGVRGHTRSIITKPKNGGMSCNTAQEMQPCNTGSCDRDCKLKKWSKWSPCSVACGGGFQERWRRVIRPVRGNGKCPKRKSKMRYGLKDCNSHECVGDEICVAKQDLVLAIDGSGSLQESGWTTLKGFAAKLIDKYMGTYYGYEDMKIGVVQFGNGEIEKDGSVAGAVEVLGLTSDMGKVKKAIEGMNFLKGFTNMAQAFTSAEKLFLLEGRQLAQSAVLTLTDGKPSFLFQTAEKVMQLRDKHTKLFFAPVTEFKGEELKVMQEWASQPWETHLVHIPGLEALKADEAIFAQKAIVKFCPEAFSPSATMAEEESMGFMLIRENGSCGERGELLSSEVTGAEDCAALAEGQGVSAFSLGIKYARGRCFAEKLEVTEDMIADFNKDRANPPCPGGEWKKDGLYDFYALEPIVA